MSLMRSLGSASRWRGLSRPFHAGESRHVPARSLVGFGSTEAATVAALALGVGLMAVTVLRLVCLPISQPVLFGLAEIAGENARIRADMRIGVEDPEAVACHRSLPSNGRKDYRRRSPDEE